MEVVEQPKVKVEIDGDGIKTGQVLKPSHFNVKADTDGNLTVNILDPLTNIVKPNISKNGKGDYTVSYQPLIPGVYEIEPIYNGKPVEGSPFRATVHNSPSLVIRGDGLEDGTVGPTSRFIYVEHATTPIEVRVIGPTGAPLPTNFIHDKTKPGHYIISYLALIPGTYHIHVINDVKSNLGMSPYKVTLRGKNIFWSFFQITKMFFLM